MKIFRSSKFGILLPFIVNAAFSPGDTTFSCGSLSASTTVGSLNQFTFTAKDSGGGDYTGTDLVFNGILTITSDTSNHQDPVSVTSAENGIVFTTISHTTGAEWAVSFTSYVSGTYTLQLRLQSPLTNIGPQCTVDFTPDSYDSFAISVVNPSFLTFTAGEFTSFDIIPIDQYKNPISSFVIGQASAAMAYNLATVRDDIISNPTPDIEITKVDNEKFTYEIRTNVTGTMDLTVNLDQVLFVETFQVEPGKRDYAKTIADWSFFNINRVAGQSSSSLLLSSKDEWENHVNPKVGENSKFTLVFNQTDSLGVTTGVNNYSFDAVPGTGTNSKYYVVNFGPVSLASYYRISIVREGVHIVGSPRPNLFRILPDFLFNTFSIINGIDTGFRYQSGVNYPFTVIGKDSFKNQRTDNTGFEYIKVGAVLENESWELNFPLTDLGDGTYSGNFNFNSTGNFTISATVFDAPMINSGSVVKAYAATTSQDSTVIGQGASTCRQGEKCKFVVLAYDRFQHLQQTTEDIIEITFSDDSKLESIVPIGNGQYAVEYTAGGALGAMEITVKINSELVKKLNVSKGLNNTSIGIIVGVSFFVAFLLLVAFFFFKKQKQMQKLKREWDRMRRAVYKEYQLHEDTQLKELKTADYEDEEWDDDEPTEPIKDQEWEAMENWFDKKQK